MITKYQKELLSLLGNEYSIKSIDCEPCIYRKLNSHYDIEISNTKTKNSKPSVYVWDISNGAQLSAKLVDKSCAIPNEETLLQILNKYVIKYGNLN